MLQDGHEEGLLMVELRQGRRVPKLHVNRLSGRRDTELSPRLYY